MEVLVQAQLQYTNYLSNKLSKLKPRYVSDDYSLKVFAGGKNLDEFRDKMLQESKFKKLVDFPDASDIFPDIKLEGGVCTSFGTTNMMDHAKLLL